MPRNYDIYWYPRVVAQDRAPGQEHGSLRRAETFTTYHGIDPETQRRRTQQVQGTVVPRDQFYADIRLSRAYKHFAFILEHPPWAPNESFHVHLSNSDMELALQRCNVNRYEDNDRTQVVFTGLWDFVSRSGSIFLVPQQQEQRA